MSIGDRLALVSLIIAIAALFVSGGIAFYTVWRADKTASAGALIAVQVALHDSWCRFLRATPTDEQEFEFAELLNLLETCCALYSNRSFTSEPRKLLQRYLVEVFTHLADDANARERLRDLKDTSETFAKIAAFENKYRATLSLKKPVFTAP